MQTLRTLTLAVFGFLAAPTPASASDFTFTIPVSFSNLPPEVTQFYVSCYAQLPSGASVGQGGRSLPITGGGYTGDFSVEFNALPGYDPATATRYQCSGYFIGTNPAGGVAPRYFETSYGPRFPLVTGAPFRIDTGIVPLP